MKNKDETHVENMTNVFFVVIVFLDFVVVGCGMFVIYLYCCSTGTTAASASAALRTAVLLPLFLLLLVTFQAGSHTISAVMNWYNSRVTSVKI